MKKLLLMTLALFGYAQMGMSQELITNQPTNKNETLTHSYMIHAPNGSPVAQQVAGDVAQTMQKKKLAIEHSPQLGQLADVIFLWDDGSNDASSEAIAALGRDYAQVVLVSSADAVTNNTVPQIRYRTAKEASNKIATLLTKMFYSGMRPEYSTIFAGGKDGYSAFRIPSAVALPDGRIVTFIEARNNESHDQAENDIIAKISDNGGKSWGKPILVAQADQASLNNPCVVYVPETRQIIMMYQLHPPKTTEGSTKPGLEGDDIVRVFVTRSNDRGESWSTPEDITRQAKHPEAGSVCSGPGVAIRVEAGENEGRIIVPFNGNGSTRWFNYLVYSDDLGQSWKIAPGESGYGTNESQIVQIAPAKFIVNTRSHRYIEDRDYKAPEGWNPWNFSRVTRYRANIPVVMTGNKTEWLDTEVMTNQPDPTCQGSIIRLGGFVDGEKSRILLSNPASQYTVPRPDRVYATTPPMRMNGTVKLSYDGAQTWAHTKRIYGNRFTEYQYSVLVNLGGGKIGCIFEANPEVRFAVFDLEWLTGGQDKGK